MSYVTTWMKLEDIMLNEPVTERQILQNSIYKRYLK